MVRCILANFVVLDVTLQWTQMENARGMPIGITHFCIVFCSLIYHHPAHTNRHMGTLLVKATSRAEPRLEFSRLSARLGSKSAHLRAARLGSKFEKNRRLGSARIFLIQNGSARLGSAHFFAVCILDSNQVFLYMDTQTRIYTLYIRTPRTSHAYLHTNTYV